MVRFVRELFASAPKAVAVDLVVLPAVLAVALGAALVLVAVDVIADPGGHRNLDWFDR